MPNGFMDWQPLDDDEVTLGQVWGVLGVLTERSKGYDDLVTRDQCRLKRAEEREIAADEVRDDKDRAGARRYSALLVLLASLLSAVLAVGGGVLLRTGG